MNTNKTLTRVVLITAAVTVAALGIALLMGLATSGFRWGSFGRVGTPVDERQSVSLDGVENLVMESVSDDIILADGTGATLDAWLHGSASGASENPLRLVAERNGSTVTVRVERAKVIIMGFNWSNVRLDVSVPTGYAGNLSVKTTSGNIQVGDRRYGALALNSTSGDVKVGSVTAASFKAHSTSGNVNVEALSANTVDISAVSGDLRLASLAGDTTLHTTSGNVNAAFTVVPSRIDAGSTSGDVTLKLPADAQFMLDARSTSGNIRCAFPITIAQGEAGGRRTLSGAVGTGAAKVTLRTTSGDIRIQK